MKLIAATKNKNKIKELEEIFAPLGFEVEAGVFDDVEETGDTFEENSLLKARAVSKLYGEFTVADDSGLCVEALGGRPGVYSARYAGEGASDRDKYEKLLLELSGEKDRRAKFVTAASLVFPDGREITAVGEVEGLITEEPAGEGGFGYDPVFFCPELGKTFGEAAPEEKNSVSHRARAMEKLSDKLRKNTHRG